MRISTRVTAAACLFAGALVFLAFRLHFGPGLENPEAVGAFLNSKFPSSSQGAIQVVSTDENVNTGLAIAPEPRGNRMFVAERGGRVYTFIPGNDGLSGKTSFMDFSEQVMTGQDSGVLGMAFHPDYNKVGSPNSAYIYFYYTTQRDGKDYVRLSRFSGTVNSELVMFEQELGEQLHRGGAMLFGKDGFLYLTVGDLGWMDLAQNITERLSGGVLRIDVDKRGGSISHAPRRTLADVGHGISGIEYYIPNDNPFQDAGGGVFEEYYSIGSRNPHRLTMDRNTGTMYIGNVGSNSGDKREEVNVLAKKANYGWPFREGTLERPDLMERPDPILGNLTDPIHEYRHVSGDGCSVIGGYVYRGSQIPELFGKYIFTDYCSKKVWALDVSANPIPPKQEIMSLEFDPVTFGEDAAGELYIAVQGWHPVYKITAGNGGGGAIPSMLSQTGAFTNLTTMTPSAGVIPFEVIAPLWSDGAVKSRWVAIPNDGTHNSSAERVVYSPEGDWTFPEGTVFIKHFEIAMDESKPTQRRRLETRFLVHGEGGAYYSLTYKWNGAGTDATLLEDSMVEDLLIKEVGGGTRTQKWLYPSRSDCFVCHTGAAGRVLGPKARQLNSDLFYPSTGLTGNQLESWNHIGIFEPAINIGTLPGLLTSKNIADGSASVESRARSYLDANCAGCHRPGGGPRSEFDLRLSVDLEDSGALNGDVIEDLGIAGAKIIVPGDPDRSILYQRIAQVNTSTAMPPLAKNKLDTEAVSLIRDWILSIDPTRSDTDKGDVSIPVSMQLHANYPNPFSQATTISYELPRESHVRLTVYDLQGREVQTLVDARQPAGRQSAVFQAQELASGLYIYELEAGGQRVTKTMAVRR